jgi:hypothetical protein
VVAFVEPCRRVCEAWDEILTMLETVSRSALGLVLRARRGRLARSRQTPTCEHSPSIVVRAALAKKYVIDDSVPGVVDADKEQQQHCRANPEQALARM